MEASVRLRSPLLAADGKTAASPPPVTPDATSSPDRSSSPQSACAAGPTSASVSPYDRWFKGAIRWNRLSCRSFAANAVRLQLHALAYDLGNFLRTLATPEPIQNWSLTNLKEKLIKIGAKVVSHDRYVAFQMAEVAIPRNLFADILQLIAELRPPPLLSTA